MNSQQDTDEDLRVMDKGLFFGGGIGTYMFLGKTNSGKNYFLKHAIDHAYFKTHIKFDNVLVFSRTAKVSGDYNYLEDYVDEGCFSILASQRELQQCVDQRTLEVEKVRGNKALSDKEVESWLRESAILIILDDFAGVTNMSSTISNPIFNLVTLSRHLGIWLCFLTQYSKIIGPGYWQNSRAVVSFDSSDRAFKSATECISGSIKDYAPQVINKVKRWPDSKKFACCIWWNFWFGLDKPNVPWLLSGVEEKKFVLRKEDIIQPFPLKSARFTSK